MVLDYAYGSASFVMPNVLAKLGAEVLVVNPYAPTAGDDVASTATTTPPGWPSWCGRRAPTSGR